ncbi:uncharacterized protein LOC111307315 [Durio zibethinus]|uniref:Uncharacterized protein LOC111307315 n=1 Tax=Durio zibethinus TaxID=66656 RepID=A0A6P6A8B0_DURZI|nr:uncharacterized protein LOC111307315 [Durio zibethinus]XP_022761062.1 uncharacterized protein LOC111307315 [Durio zibethinus]
MAMTEKLKFSDTAVVLMALAKKVCSSSFLQPFSTVIVEAALSVIKLLNAVPKHSKHQQLPFASPNMCSQVGVSQLPRRYELIQPSRSEGQGQGREGFPPKRGLEGLVAMGASPFVFLLFFS